MHHRMVPSFLRSKRQSQEEGGQQQPEGESLQSLIENDPKEPALLIYFAAITVGLFGLGTAAFKLGGQLAGLGFGDDRYAYWDSAPSYALLLVYPPLFLLFPESRPLLVKTLVVSFVVTALIYFFPYDAIGWDPTPEHILIMIGLPVTTYTSYFTLRASKVYREILDEEEAAAAAADNKEREKSSR